MSGGALQPAHRKEAFATGPYVYSITMVARVPGSNAS
jgi:hypothetical protein